MSSQLGLLMLLVKDVPRSKTFYTENLGLEVVPEFSGDEFVMMRSRSGGTSIALQQTTGESYGVPLAHGGIIPGFEVEDADSLYQQWKAQSIELVGEVIDIGAGRSFTARGCKLRLSSGSVSLYVKAHPQSSMR
jgi:catechol 2,3-dioxygenase-like lactoylglutathione lyase family enzyme